ncbi:MAG TPA: 3-phosphoshikimate 1-carboxyvinyltransferase [Bacteroidales bacterium]|nr:3-phosphoshikimate 1-carboxyvinyltransferase [Bacteroidales bacterium]HPS17768.1 3-phosphoshikimate 1-carboxyvinyltransferase [Bacteroidales bacterium]
MQGKLHIAFHQGNDCTIDLPASKSECNRALIINALSEGYCKINNISEADDTRLLIKALTSNSDVIDVGNAGTAMRFLLSYLSVSGKNITLTGSERMKQRPIKHLVEALRLLGADIEYLQENGYPPIKIHGDKSKMKGGDIKIPANISSQFISSLLMIAPVLENGMNMVLVGDISSKPYIEMTLSIMKHFGIEYLWEGNKISIRNQNYIPAEYNVESDWTNASYWYSIVALAKNAAIFLKGLKRNSFQGDAVISKWFEPFGVVSEFTDKGVFITKGVEDFSKFPRIIDFSANPDLAQTIIVLAAATDISCRFTGLESLRIKETDRIAALQNELKKFNVHFIEEAKDIYILKNNFNKNNSPEIATYNDHRMAMSFAPLAVICKELSIAEPEVVEKSYPRFWDDLKLAGFEINEASNK